MSEALQTQTPNETLHNSPEEIQEAFQGASQLLYKFTADPRFHAALIDRNIDPYDDAGSENYWAVAASRAHRFVEEARDKQGDSLKLRAFELLAATPRFVFNQHTLDTTPAHGNARHESARQSACKFNNLIRDFAEAYPEVKPSTMELNLVKVTHMAVGSHSLQQNAATYIRAAIVGAQHELGFGQLLDATGRQYYHGDINDDLHGADFKVASNHRRDQLISIDVKSSLYSVHNKGHTDKPYSINNNRNVTMYSMLRNSDFHDSFYVSEGIVKLKAPVVDRILTEAEYDRLSA